MMPAWHVQVVCTALRSAGSDLAVVDPDHRPSPGPHERDVIQAMTALQVDNLRRGAQHWLEQVAFCAYGRGTGRPLGEQIVVLPHVLARRRFPGDPIRPRHAVHDSMLTLRIPARQTINRPVARDSEGCQCESHKYERAVTAAHLRETNYSAGIRPPGFRRFQCG